MIDRFFLSALRRRFAAVALAIATAAISTVLITAVVAQDLVANDSSTMDHVLLRNGSVLSGYVERRASQYRILRGSPAVARFNKKVVEVASPTAEAGGRVAAASGGEIWLPATQVEKVAKSIDELYQHRLAAAQSRGFFGWVEVANWWLDQIELSDADKEICQRRINEVESQCEVAMQFRPNDPTLNRLKRRLEMLERGLLTESADSTGTPTVQLASHARIDAGRNHAAVNRPMDLDAVDPARFEMFVTRVQPVLANRCRHCHASGTSSDADQKHRWVLDVPAGGRALSREVSIANMQRMDEWLRQQDAPESFMRYATTAHGSGAEAPLSLRHHAAIQWVGYYVQNMPEESWWQSQVPPDQEGIKAADSMRVIESIPSLRSVGASNASANRSGESENALPENGAADLVPPSDVVPPSGRSRRGIRRTPSIANPHDPKIFHALPTKNALNP